MIAGRCAGVGIGEKTTPCGQTLTRKRMATVHMQLYSTSRLGETRETQYCKTINKVCDI